MTLIFNRFYSFIRERGVEQPEESVPSLPSLLGLNQPDIHFFTRDLLGHLLRIFFALLQCFQSQPATMPSSWSLCLPGVFVLLGWRLENGRCSRLGDALHESFQAVLGLRLWVTCLVGLVDVAPSRSLQSGRAGTRASCHLARPSRRLRLRRVPRGTLQRWCLK
jgi:hypothetical protein